MNRRQELIRQVNSRAGTIEEPRFAKGRELRIGELLDDLIAAFRRERREVDRQSSTRRRAAGVPDDVHCYEHDLIWEEVIGEVARQAMPLTASEIEILSDWGCASERSRLREKCRRLSELLDDVDQSAMLLSSDGRVEYLNREAATRLHDATGIPADQLVGSATSEMGLGLSPEKLVSLARSRTSAEEFLFARWNQTNYRAIYSATGLVESVAFVARDIHEPRLARTRLSLLSKLSTTVGRLDYPNVVELLSRLAIPELADWCVVNLVEDGRILHSALAQSNPANARLEEAVKRAADDWSKNPLWAEMKLTTGFQLLSDVSGHVLRKFAFNEEHYQLLASAGVRSIMVQPVVSHGKMVALFTFMYTTESGRRYGRDHPALTAELALHAAHLIENARLLTDLRTTETRFRVSVAAAKTVVFEYDPSLRYRWYYNPLMDDRGDSMVGKTDEDVFSAEDASALTDLKQRTLGGESVRDEVSVSLGGARRQYREAMEPLHDADNNVVGVIGAATDITEEKRVQRELSEALRFRDRMVAVLQHDLRNPLNAVKMAATAALAQDLPERLRKHLHIIQRSTERMTELLATLLDFTRAMIEGSIPHSRSHADLAACAQKVVEEARAAWPGRAIECETKGDLSGEWDSARIEQAISNLIANALQHGDPGAPVYVSGDGMADAVALKVRNEGQPISPKLMPVLFEPFTRGSERHHGHGLGLGLFIVQQIATAHGGSVNVESNAKDGTTFTLLLPRGAHG